MTVRNGNAGNRNKRKNRGARNENYTDLQLYAHVHTRRNDK
jgi:hypothetical protein